MITVHQLAIKVNTPEVDVLARMGALCKAWGEDEVIFYVGGNGSETTELTDRAATEIERMTRLRIWDLSSEPEGKHFELPDPGNFDGDYGAGSYYEHAMGKDD